MRLRDVVGPLEPRPAVRAPISLEVVKRVEDGRTVTGGSAVENDAVAAGVGDYRHRIAGIEVIDEVGERPLEKAQLVRAVHRARGVDQKDEVVAPRLRVVEVSGLEAHDEQLGIGIPWAASDLGGHSEHVRARWVSIVVVKIVEHFLDAHRTAGNVLGGVALADHPPEVGVARRIHVSGERRVGVACRAGEPMLDYRGVLLGVPGNLRFFWDVGLRGSAVSRCAIRSSAGLTPRRTSGLRGTARLVSRLGNRATARRHRENDAEQDGHGLSHDALPSIRLPLPLIRAKRTNRREKLSKRSGSTTERGSFLRHDEERPVARALALDGDRPSLGNP